MAADLRCDDRCLRFLILASFIFIHSDIISQSPARIFEHLTTDFGLSSNKVEAIIQDNDGFYWIATQNGLNRFDGTNVTIYTHHPEDSTSLSHNNCTAIALDSVGDIWIATYHGVSRYRKKEGNFQRIFLHHPTRNDEVANRIYNLAVDNSGNVWIAGNGLWKYDVTKHVITFFSSAPSTPDTKPLYTTINQLQYDATRHGLWLSTGNGVRFFDISAATFYNEGNNPSAWTLFSHSRHNEFTLDGNGVIWFRDQESQCLASFDSRNNNVQITPLKITSGIRQIQADDQNKIWIFYWVLPATIYHPATQQTDTSFFSIVHKRSVIAEQATSLFIDRQKNYWIASGNGISILREANQFYRLHQVKTNDDHTHQEDLRITSLAQTDSLSIWIASNEGLFRYDLMSGQTTKIPLLLPAEGINTILATGDSLWIGAHDQLICYSLLTQQIVSRITLQSGIFFIVQDDQSQIWAGLWTKGLYHIDPLTQEVTHFVKDTTLSSSLHSNNLITALPDEHALWIGYNGGVGFSKYTVPLKVWNHYQPALPQEKEQATNSGTVTVITKVGEQLWLGTHGGGIFLFSPAANSYEHFDQAQGLNSNYINSILADDEGRLWISTADGMNIMDAKKHTIRPVDIPLTFRDNDFRHNSLKGKNGNLFFFYNDQVLEIIPSSFKIEQATPQLVISHFTVFDQERYLADMHQPIVLSHDENFFSFGFSAIKTHPHHQMHYAYRIKGFDKDWIYTDRPFANYTNVSFGHYLFQVKAANEDGLFGDPLINLPLIIHPPFWLTWWFILLTILTILALFLAVYRYRIMQIKKVMAMRARISRDLHDEVGSTLSSIHVYSSVAAKAMDKNPTATRDALQVIHDNSRQVMENMGDIVWAINTGEQSEISLEKKLKNYGFELLTPLGIVTNYSISADAEQNLTHMEARKNILLITKEAMNNIARYSKASMASIELILAGQQMKLSIYDNGIGFDTGNHKAGNGLKNIRSRSESLGGKCDIQSGSGSGTTILCSFPITSIREN